MSSWICGKNVQAQFCNGVIADDCLNDNGVTEAGAAMSPQTGMNDTMTTLKMQKYDAVSGTGAATLFADPYCKGRSGAFFASSSVGVPKSYNASEMKKKDFCNDCINAIMVPVGYTVELYAADGLTGSSYTV